MLIKFKGTDPRAGTVAQMDSIRGQQLIDGGMAVLHSESSVAAVDPAIAKRAGLDAAIARLPEDYTDPDYVVNGMRFHYGDTFTDADEAKVRELVKRPVPLQSSVVASDAGVTTPAVDASASLGNVVADSAVKAPVADAVAVVKPSSRKR